MRIHDLNASLSCSNNFIELYRFVCPSTTIQVVLIDEQSVAGCLASGPTESFHEQTAPVLEELRFLGPGFGHARQGAEEVSQPCGSVVQSETMVGVAGFSREGDRLCHSHLPANSLDSKADDFTWKPIISVTVCAARALSHNSVYLAATACRHCQFSAS